MIPSPTMNSVRLGPINLHFYGIIVALAITTSYILALKFAKKKNFTSEEIDKYFFLVIPVALVFARAYHVGTNWSIYKQNPTLILAIWNGGLGILGGILGGLLTLYWLSKKTNRKFLAITDFLSPFLALGQAIGRWGNYINQELYGRPTKLPWAIKIDPQNRISSVKQFETFHPTFFYESALSFSNFVILYIIDRRFKLKEGCITGMYLINYGIIRFVVELYKLDPDTDSKIGPLRVPQYFALFLILIGLSLILKNYYSTKNNSNI